MHFKLQLAPILFACMYHFANVSVPHHFWLILIAKFWWAVAGRLEIIFDFLI